MQESQSEPVNKPCGQPMVVGRFDYVRYDDQSAATQREFKERFEALEIATTALLKDPRAKALVLTKLEEAYMWVGKAIRDDQRSRGGPSDDQPHRSNE